MTLAGRGTAAVALDTNAVIAAVEGGQAILGGRAPVVSITAVKEFLRGGAPLRHCGSSLPLTADGLV